MALADGSCRAISNKAAQALGLLAWALLLAGCSAKDPGATPGTAEGGEQPAAGEAEPQRPLTAVTLALNWFPESEHGGYYAAQVRGIYRQAGLDLKIQSGGPSARMLEQVAAGRATFGIANADNILFARAGKMPLVALLAPLQDSPRCIMVHKATGIDTFDKLQDVTLAMTPGAAFADFLRWKLPLPGVRIVPYTSGSIQAFLVDTRYAQQGYVFSEPFLARQQGADPGVLMVSELGFNPYTSLLFTTEETIARHPDMVRHMVTASAEGWQDYLADPEPTNRRIHELNPVVDMEALAFGAREIAPLIATDEAREQGLGTMTLDRWQALVRQLVESGQLSAGAVDPKGAFSVEFLPALPPPGAESAKIPVESATIAPR